MKKYIYYIFAIISLAVSIPVTAAFFEEPQGYANTTLKGLKTITVKIDPPRGSDYSELIRYGISSEKLQEMVTVRLQEAGFNVISYSESLADKDAVLLDLRVRVDIPRGSFYAYDLKLSVNQKIPLTPGAGSFYSVRTWSDRQIGALQQTGTGLTPLLQYSMQLVDNFIKDHHAQN